TRRTTPSAHISRQDRKPRREAISTSSDRSTTILNRAGRPRSPHHQRTRPYPHRRCSANQAVNTPEPAPAASGAVTTPAATPAARPRPVSAADREAFDALAKEALPAVRSMAAAWRTGLTALITLVTTGIILKGRTE